MQNRQRTGSIISCSAIRVFSSALLPSTVDLLTYRVDSMRPGDTQTQKIFTRQFNSVAVYLLYIFAKIDFLVTYSYNI